MNHEAHACVPAHEAAASGKTVAKSISKKLSRRGYMQLQQILAGSIPGYEDAAAAATAAYTTPTPGAYTAEYEDDEPVAAAAKGAGGGEWEAEMADLPSK